MSLPGRLAAALLDALFPPRCVACGATGALLCATCRTTIRAPQPPLCARCGTSLQGPHAQPAALRGTDGEQLCEVCAAGQGPAALNALRAAAPLGALLARGCARARGFPLRTDVLTRQRDTRPQVGLSAADRRSNVADAFTLTSPRAAALLDGERILLIDDVATTGSTLDAAAAALLPAHPATIWGLAVTRPELAADNADAQAHLVARSRAAHHGVSTASDRRVP